VQAVVAIRMAAGGDAARDALAGVATIAASGLLIALSAPGVGDVASLAWIAFAPWFALLHRLRAPAAALSGLLMGYAYIIPGHWSTFAAAVGSTGLQGFERELWTLAFFTPYAIPFLIYGALDGALRRYAGPDALTRMALLRAAVLASLICLIWSPFPYTPVTAIVDFHGIVQWAALGGEPLLLTLLLWPSALLAASAVERPAAQRIALALAILGLTLGLASVAGAARIAANDRAEAAGAGLRLSALTLQLDLPPGSSPGLVTRNRAHGSQSAVELTRRGYAEAPQCELAVWPEVPVDARQGERLCAAGQALAASTGRPLLMQCHRPVGEQFQLTAEWLRPNAVPFAHAKSRLVLGYERPILGTSLVRAGTPGAVIDLDAQRRLIPALCYELYAGAHVRRSVLAGGQFIAHQVSFGGFDRQPIDRWDQPMARLTAIAYGVPILRSSNRAPIGWIDANGRVRAESERFGRRAECHTVWSPAASPTTYVHIAPLAPVLPALLLLAGVGLAGRRTTLPTTFLNRRRS
jgi:apolipoprotein N-acyltransferase